MPAPVHSVVSGPDRSVVSGISQRGGSNRTRGGTVRVASGALVFGVFVASSLAIVLLTYTLLASSLAERDRQIVVSTLREYSARYASGGLAAVARAVDIEQRSGRHERLFVRVVRGGTETLFASMPPEWSDFDVSRLIGRADHGSRPRPDRAMRGSRSLRRGCSTARCSRSARAPRAAKSCWLGSARLPLSWPSPSWLTGLAGGCWSRDRR